MNQLWLRQVGAVVRLELSRSLLLAGVAPLYLLALLPVFVVGLMVAIGLLVETDGTGPFGLTMPGRDLIVYSIVYEFVLRLVVYAGCVWIFMNLFRGEVLDRSLHYYFLAPIRREVLVAGKFLAGWITASILFAGSAVVAKAVLYLYFGVGRSIGEVLGSGIGHTLGYVAVTLLACLGYGVVFLVVGLFMRNPIIPALLIWLVEMANPYLPALLKKISVIFYLRSLLPVTADVGPFAIFAEPVSPWLAVPGLMVFSAVLLSIAAMRIRSMEIAYGDD